MRWCDRLATGLVHRIDQTLDPDRRQALLDRLFAMEAADGVSLPLFVSPLTTAWRTDLIAGPIGAYASSPEGVYFNMDHWYVPNA